MARVGVVVVTYRSAATIGNCLTSLRAASQDPIEIVVVDNASDDDTAAAATAADANALVISRATNDGYGVANNAGVSALAPDTAATIGAADRGYPVASLRDLPAGEYWMQPFVNVYTRFARADGKTVWLHMDQGEGQNWKRSPGNLFGAPVKVTFDPSSAEPVRLTADRVIPPIDRRPSCATS